MKRKKAILFNPLDKNYGSAYRGRLLAQALEHCGLDCVYVEANCSESLPVHKLVTFKQKNNFFSYVITSLKRFKFALACDYDLCVVQKTLPLSILPALAALLRGKKVILDWDDLEICFQRSLFRRAAVICSEWLLVSLPVKIVTHSEYIKEYIHRKYNRKADFLAQAIDDDFFSCTDADRDAIRRRYNIEDRVVFGYLVTFNAGSIIDFDIVLDLYRQIEKLCDNAVLFLIGGGPMYDKVKEMVAKSGAKQAIFSGFVAHEMVPDFLSACDACLIAMDETNPANLARVSLKLAEYCALKRPVLGNVVGESRQRLGEYVYPWSAFVPGGCGCRVAERTGAVSTFSFQTMCHDLKRILADVVA
jgi:glycosyltransferase involved in cell wall biosynthesis